MFIYTSGQGIAGVAVALSSILSAFAATPETTNGNAGDDGEESSTNRSAFIYFMSALLVTVAAFIGRIILSQQPFYRYQLQQEKPLFSSDNHEEGSERQDNDGNDDDDSLHGNTSSKSLKYILQQSYGLIFAVAYVFIITLMVFPTITSLIKSVVRHPPSVQNHLNTIPSRFYDDDVFIAFHFLLFNVGDWVGRFLPLWSLFRTFNTSNLVLLSVLRTLFIPIFLICNVVISTERLMPVLIQSDILYFIIILIFSISNGWIGSLTMMAAPQQSFIRTSDQKSKIGSIMSFSLVVGLAIGGTLSFWVRSLI